MEPEIKILKEKKLIGMHRPMSLRENTTGILWKEFMPRRKEITNTINTHLISMQIYPQAENADVRDPQTCFQKWAALEVFDFNIVPDGMATCILPGGLYAVFHYQGLSTDTSIFRYIFGNWLPASAYILDNRPHFEILGERYKNNDPASEEDICIPIILK